MVDEVVDLGLLMIAYDDNVYSKVHKGNDSMRAGIHMAQLWQFLVSFLLLLFVFLFSQMIPPKDFVMAIWNDEVDMVVVRLHI